MSFEGLIAFSIAVVFVSVVVAIILAVTETKKPRKIITPVRVLFAGTAIAAFALYLPLCYNKYHAMGCGNAEVGIMTVLKTAGLFLMDGELDDIALLGNVSDAVLHWYSAIFSVLILYAPALSLAYVISIFKNVTGYIKYVLAFFKEVYVFSSLNAQSLALARSIRENNKKRIIIFCNTTKNDLNKEVYEKASVLHPICFKRKISKVMLGIHSKKKKLSFLIMDSNEEEMIKLSFKLIDKYGRKPNTHLYIFSPSQQTELVVSTKLKGFEIFDDGGELLYKLPMKVRRVNISHALVQNDLYTNGYENIFKTAKLGEDGIKHINAIVVGLGAIGTEMAKALPWFCQMDGYRLRLDIFDVNKRAKEIYKGLAPELMSNNHKHDDEDALYDIEVHQNIDVKTSTFAEKIAELKDTTFVFVALGNDDVNVSTALKIRSIFEAQGDKPVIQAVVYSNEKVKNLRGAVNFNNLKYDIDFIGDERSVFSEDVVLFSELEDKALKRHLKWGREDDFWRYDYNYRSSVASALHYKMKHLCGMPDIEKAPAERSPENRRRIRVVEHSRWNAYMRSEGWRYCGTTEKSGRNDIAKIHNCLVRFSELPAKEQEKDDD